MAKQFDINDKDDFENIVNDIRWNRALNGGQYKELYRGQSKDSYVLKSGITRYIDSIGELKKLEKNLISDFKELIKKTPNSKKFIQLINDNSDFENKWRWIEQIQHYGLPTRLLDWTSCPEIALFFAVESHQSDVGQFWVYKSELNWSGDEHFKIDPFSDNIDIITSSSFYVDNDYKSKIAEERRSFQNGKFTFQDYKKSLIPMESQEKFKNRIFKYTINPKSKQDLLKYLSRKNVTTENVYVETNKEIETIIKKVKEKYGFR